MAKIGGILEEIVRRNTVPPNAGKKVWGAAQGAVHDTLNAPLGDKVKTAAKVAKDIVMHPRQAIAKSPVKALLATGGLAAATLDNLPGSDGRPAKTQSTDAEAADVAAAVKAANQQGFNYGDGRTYTQSVDPATGNPLFSAVVSDPQQGARFDAAEKQRVAEAMARMDQQQTAFDLLHARDMADARGYSSPYDDPTFARTKNAADSAAAKYATALGAANDYSASFGGAGFATQPSKNKGGKNGVSSIVENAKALDEVDRQSRIDAADVVANARVLAKDSGYIDGEISPILSRAEAKDMNVETLMQFIAAQRELNSGLALDKGQPAVSAMDYDVMRAVQDASYRTGDEIPAFSPNVFNNTLSVGEKYLPWRAANRRVGNIGYTRGDYAESPTMRSVFSRLEAQERLKRGK